jgi:hypothetical protein
MARVRREGPFAADSVEKQRAAGAESAFVKTARMPF